jgi:hypothetical protein
MTRAELLEKVLSVSQGGDLYLVKENVVRKRI